MTDKFKKQYAKTLKALDKAHNEVNELAALSLEFNPRTCTELAVPSLHLQDVINSVEGIFKRLSK
jgi:hypothetical protein